MENRLQPTTIMLSKSANELLKKLAEENGMVSRYFFTKIIVREARAEATALSADKLKERLALINRVEDELVDLINNPPKVAVADKDLSTRPKSIYMRVWDTHKRLEKKGWSKEAIREYCLARYGMDYDIKPTPSKSPKKNPDWVGGGARARQ